jgi:hypothetical protein
VWTVVRQEIETTEILRVTVIPRPNTPSRFEAYVVEPAGGRMEIQLRGPTGALDEARRQMGDAGTISLTVDDLPPGQLEREAVYTWINAKGRFDVQFPPHLLDGVPDVRVRVYRRTEQKVHVEVPQVTGLPKGYELRDVKIDPPEITELAAAGALGKNTIKPDDIDLSREFQRKDVLSTPLTRVLTFDAWRQDPAFALPRARIVLPKVTLTGRIASKTKREIENALVPLYSGSKDDALSSYEWKLTSALPDYRPEQQRYKGVLRGGEADLEAFAKNPGDWMYGLHIDEEEIAAFRAKPDKEIVVKAPLILVPLSPALKKLDVEVEPPPSFAIVQVTVTKKE